MRDHAVQRKDDAGRSAGADRLFYDGSCGLCHRVVRFVLAEDPQGEKFRFAPLDSDAYRVAVAKEQRQSLPDSVVLVTAVPWGIC